MKHSKRKTEIYEAAIQLFRAKGYAAASMRDIAEAVGIEASSLYSHIKSKEDILRDICVRCSKMFDEGMSEVLSSDESRLQKIRSLVHLHIHIATNYPGSVTVFNDEWKHLPEEAKEPFIASRRAYESNFRTLLREGMEAGEFTPRSTKVVFNILINSTKWLHHYPRKLADTEITKFEKDIIAFVEAGLLN